MTEIEPITDEVLAELMDKERREKKDNLRFVKHTTVLIAVMIGIIVSLMLKPLTGLISAIVILLIGIIIIRAYSSNQPSMP